MENQNHPRDLIRYSDKPHLTGRPSHFKTPKQFVEYVRQIDDIRFCKRISIARHWHQHHSSH